MIEEDQVFERAASSFAAFLGLLIVLRRCHSSAVTVRCSHWLCLRIIIYINARELTNCSKQLGVSRIKQL